MKEMKIISCALNTHYQLAANYTLKSCN